MKNFLEIVLIALYATWRVIRDFPMLIIRCLLHGKPGEALYHFLRSPYAIIPVVLSWIFLGKLAGGITFLIILIPGFAYNYWYLGRCLNAVDDQNHQEVTS